MFVSFADGILIRFFLVKCRIQMFIIHKFSMVRFFDLAYKSSSNQVAIISSLSNLNIALYDYM